ncbi:MAG: peptidoglycan-associated lipoprotein Pal [Rhodospirillales bacterium]|nr:peptidoglycan-associated lipoprotein Pal [Rhodospirillales bacterium]
MRFATVLFCAALTTLAGCSSPLEDTAGAGAGGVAASSPGDASGASGMGATGVTGAPLDDATANAVQQNLAATGDRVYFDFDSYALTPEARATIEQQAALLNRTPSVSVTIEGHADERGTREYNLALGDRRANSVKDALISYGVSPGRIDTLSYGEERPEVLGSNDAAWARNRRAATTVTGGRAGS